MGRKLLTMGGIAAVLIALAAFIVSRPRTVYQPINLMNGDAPDATTPNLSLTQTAVLALSASSEGMISYTVQSGETLYAIALAHHLTPQDIAVANGMDEAAIIYAGQTLLLPMQPTPADTDNAAPAQVASLPTAMPTIEDISLLQAAALTPAPSSINVNGIPLDTIVVMPQDVISHIRNVFLMGQGLGRNPRAFSKLGDSTIENPHFLTRFDGGPYNLGAYAYLQGAITFYTGSFGRQGEAVHRGLHTWSVFDPMWATSSNCQPGENMLACELRVQNSSIVIIHLGSNDAGIPETTERNFREIVEYCMNNGVIPILGTKADRHEGSNINNEIIRRIAFDYNLPLWDFDTVAATLPGKGLDQDGTHMTAFFAHDWSSPVAFERGYGLMNLTALMALDKVWRAIMHQP